MKKTSIFLALILLLSSFAFAVDIGYGEGKAVYIGGNEIYGLLNGNNNWTGENWFHNFTWINWEQFNVTGQVNATDFCYHNGTCISSTISELNDSLQDLNNTVDNIDLQYVTDRGATTDNDITISDSRANVNYKVQSTNPFGSSGYEMIGDDGGRSAIARLGSGIPGFEGLTGFVNYDGEIFVATSNNRTISFGTFPNESTSDVEFSIQIDPELEALVFQGKKYIRPVEVNGGDGLLFQSTDVLTAGGFPFIWVAQNSQNETIVQQWLQNGRNNSFSGIQNSFVPVPQSWVNFGMGDPLGQDLEGVDFLFNVSDYVKYCDYLQNNLSLIPEGCFYFADTSGRLVPLTGAGDLEVHRTATIHEGLLVFENFNFIGRNGNDADFFFNGDQGGKVHVRDNRIVLANITNLDRTICNFDDATLCDFVVETISPEPGRDWRNVLEPECYQDRCAKANGGVDKIMSFSEGTQNADNINISFWVTIDSGIIDDNLIVNLDDNLGNTTDILTISGDVINEQYSFIMPDLYENKTNVTTTWTFDGQNNNRQVWLDEVRVTANFTEPIEINDPYEGGRVVLGEDRGNLSCAIDVNKKANNETLGSEWYMTFGSIDCSTEFYNATFVDSTVVNETNIGDFTVTGNISEGGVNLIDKYLTLSGDNANQNINLQGYNITNATNIPNWYYNATGDEWIMGYVGDLP